MSRSLPTHFTDDNNKQKSSKTHEPASVDHITLTASDLIDHNPNSEVESEDELGSVGEPELQFQLDLNDTESESEITNNDHDASEHKTSDEDHNAAVANTHPLTPRPAAAAASAFNWDHLGQAANTKKQSPLFSYTPSSYSEPLVILEDIAPPKPKFELSKEQQDKINRAMRDLRFPPSEDNDSTTKNFNLDELDENELHFIASASAVHKSDTTSDQETESEDESGTENQESTANNSSSFFKKRSVSPPIPIPGVKQVTEDNVHRTSYNKK